jgi:uncharacterized membrane protein YcaP (DUF421 family)
MHVVLAIDWREVFVPSMSLLEVVFRGSFLYLTILFLLRLFRREAGAMSTADLLVIVLVADAAQNAMAAEYKSITEGVVLVATIFAWNYVLDWLAFRYRWVYRLLHPAPLLLVKEGRVQRRNLKSEMLTLDDLLEQLREQGIESVAQVKRCFLEADGHLSVIKQEPDDGPRPRKENAGID